MTHAVLAGGVGAARYLRGALEALDPTTVTAVINVADDVPSVPQRAGVLRTRCRAQHVQRGHVAAVQRD